MLSSASLDLTSPASLMRSLGLEPTPAQAAFLAEAGPRACFAAGRGAGKSTAGLVLALHAALSRSPMRVLVVTPTVRDAADLFGRMVDWVLAAGGDCQASRMRLVMHFPNGSTAWFLCATRGPEWFRGLFYDLVVVDRAETVPAEVKDALAGLLRPGSRLVALEEI